jgi:hypothetical protein
VLVFFFFSLLQTQYSFSVLCACCFNDYMTSESSVLIKSVWCPGGFLYLTGKNFLEIWKFFCYYFIEYIMNSFSLDLFSFFNSQDSQVRSFDVVGEFLHFPFTALELVDCFFSFFL